MEDIEFLKSVNDQIILSLDEPVYQSVERFIHTMSGQLEIAPEQIKDALDFAYLAKRQRELARPVIEAYVKEHPYQTGTNYAVYGEELLKAHPGIHVMMIEQYIKEMQGKCLEPHQQEAAIKEEDGEPRQEELKKILPAEEKVKVPLPVQPAPEIPQSWKHLASLLRICGKIIFWFSAVIAVLIALSSFIQFFTSSSIYYYGASYVLSLLFGQLFIAVLLLFGSYVAVLVLNALACLLDKGDPSIPFHHFR